MLWATCRTSCRKSLSAAAWGGVDLVDRHAKRLGRQLSPVELRLQLDQRGVAPLPDVAEDVGDDRRHVEGTGAGLHEPAPAQRIAQRRDGPGIGVVEDGNHGDLQV